MRITYAYHGPLAIHRTPAGGDERKTIKTKQISEAQSEKTERERESKNNNNKNYYYHHYYHHRHIQ